MKRRDKENLQYLLSLDKQGYKEWYKQSAVADSDYAEAVVRPILRPRAVK